MAHIDAGRPTTERVLYYTASRTRLARCTGYGDDGLDGTGAGARYYDYQRCNNGFWERNGAIIA